MLRDLRLRLPDEAAWLALDFDRTPGVVEIDEIGTFYDPPAEPDGTPIELEGWHVNIRCRDDRDLSALDPWLVSPVTPRRVWA